MKYWDRTLVLLRHAKSERPEGVGDTERPLAARGRQDAPAAGTWLSKNVPDIDLVLCSPAKRAQQTWELAAAEFSPTPRMRSVDEIYDASAEDLLAVVRLIRDSHRTVVLVGHNPGLEDLVFLLTGTDEPLKTSAIAILGGEGSWSDAKPQWAKLDHLALPRA